LTPNLVVFPVILVKLFVIRQILNWRLDARFFNPPALFACTLVLLAVFAAMLPAAGPG
jgi:hypothetical protein